MPTSTTLFSTLVFLTALVGAAWAHDAHAGKKTVCSITVNSPDEKEAFQRSLPADKYQFVELVDRGRSDWLESACRQGVRCDILVISGHYDGGNEFFSDQVESREFLPVAEMERVSCSASCPGMFSQLKEVYLFGCNTLNPEALTSASAEVGRSLVRSGHSRAEADQISRQLSARHGESSRDRMRLIFRDVPAIYGFSSVAPLGPTAGSILNRYFQSAGTSEIGSGRPSTRLLGQFAGHSMAVSSGVTDSDPRMTYRRDVCQFSDDRLSPAQKIAFVHQLLRREMAEVRMFFDRIEKYSASLTDAQRQAPEVAQALQAIARDETARARYFEFARDADEPAVRARMIELAQRLGWLTPAEKRAELMQMIGDRIAKDAVSSADVDLVCALNKDHELGRGRDRLQLPSALAGKVSTSGILACLDSAEARAQMLLALTSTSEDEVQIAQVYLRHHPIADVDELRVVTSGISRMNGSSAKVRALDTLAGQNLSDRESLEELARMFPGAESVGVQTAIAGVLIRADYRAMARPQLVQTLQQHRLRSSNGADVIDVLIRRLQAP